VGYEFGGDGPEGAKDYSDGKERPHESRHKSATKGHVVVLARPD